MSLERPPFCKFNYCPDGVACMSAEKCLSIDGLPGRIEYPDGKTSPALPVNPEFERLLKAASDRPTAPQDDHQLTQERELSLSGWVHSLDLSGLRTSIDKAGETIDYLREVNNLLERRLRAIITADTRYQSAQIALRADGRFANMQEAEVASEKMRAAIEDAKKALVR